MRQLIYFIVVFCIISSCQETKKKGGNDLENSTIEATGEIPLVAPKNPFVADGVYPIPHGEPAQQDATDIPGPIDKTRVLAPHEIKYVFTGPGSIGGYTSNKYSNGQRVIWLSAINGIFKINEETYEIIDHIPTEKAETYTEAYAERFIQSFDENTGIENIPLAAEASKVWSDVSGVYAVVDKDNRLYVADKLGNITAYGDVEAGNIHSEIEVKGKFTIPKEASGPTLGMNVTYDGWIIMPTENGFLVAVSRDLKEYRLVRLKYATDENTRSQGLGKGWVRNSIAIDKHGGIYVASRDHMHKVIWNGESFSTDEKDGAWTAKYSNTAGLGTGATPSLMGFGDEDQFVVITDGDVQMNVTLFWRNEIPKDWNQLENTPSRRIAGMTPVNMGELQLKEIQTEQSAIVAGYGVFVVNNSARNIPEAMPKKVSGLIVGNLGSNPQLQPYGVEKFEWNPKTRTLASAWANTKVSSPNGVPYVSLGSNMVYFIGARENKWTLEALNWKTGKSVFYYTIGGQKYNSLYSGPVINEDGSIMYGSSWGRVKLIPDSDE